MGSIGESKDEMSSGMLTNRNRSVLKTYEEKKKKKPSEKWERKKKSIFPEESTAN
jgi:hypothetical protein